MVVANNLFINYNGDAITVTSETESSSFPAHTVTVANNGEREGKEIVQLYVRDLVGSVTRPVKELKGFRAVDLAPGEERDVTFELTTADLAFYTARGRWEAEPGDFRVFVGTNSENTKAAAFTLR